jgi:PadR family transcriptional regulator, regulatory protein AphA
MSPMVRRPPGIELTLLGFLQQGSKHGYQIHQMLSDPAGLGPIWQLKQSQLYALLTKLEMDGYMAGVLEAQTGAHPPRRMFQLTPLGRSAYQDWITSPVNAPRLMRQEFMAKLYFAQRENKDAVRKLIEKQQIVCQNWVAEFNRQLSASEPESFRWNMFQYRVGQIEAMMGWLETIK